MYYTLESDGSIKKSPSYTLSSNKSIKRTQYGKVLVSTVFLSMDHSMGQGRPVLFETMVMGGEYDGHMERYYTLQEAEDGHDQICIMLRNTKIESILD